MALKRLYAVSRRSCLPIFLFSIILLSACDKKEGCVDPNATNYTIDAEKNCCCTYPKLVTEIAFKIGEENLILGDTFINDQGLAISIIDFAIYTSDFELTDGIGQLSQVSDLLEIGTQTVVDDILLIKRNEFRYPIGTFNEMRVFEQIQFKIGLLASINLIDLSEISLPDDHPLLIQEDSLYLGPAQGYYFIKLKAQIAEDQYTFTYTEAVPVELDLIVTPFLGQDVIIPIKIQFDQWFSGIEVSMDDLLIRTKIFENIQASIDVDE